MKGYITTGNVYYEAEEPIDPATHIEVPLRAGPNFDWNGTEWVENVNPETFRTTAILQSPNGTAFRVSVDDDGTLKTEEI